MNSYLKQVHTKEVEKIGVNSYKVLLNFNDSAWNINKHYSCMYFKKSPVTFMLKTTSILLFTNSCHRVVDSGVINLTISDHSLIFCVLKSGCPKAPGRPIQYRSYKNYSRLNFVNELDNINWEAVENEPDINAAVNNWNALFTEIANHHAPVKQTRLKGVSHPWMNSQLSKEMQNRDKLYKSAIRVNNKEQWDLYKKQNNFVNSWVSYDVINLTGGQL